MLGSLAAVGLSNMYYKRAAERRRRAKYSALTGEGMEEDDLELGQGPGLVDGVADGQETGVVGLPPRSVEEELDNWDENAEDEAWDEDDITNSQDAKITPATRSTDSEDHAPERVAVD